MACSAYATTTSTPTFNGGGGVRRYFPTVAKECHTLRLLSAGVLSFALWKNIRIFFRVILFSSLRFITHRGPPNLRSLLFLLIRLIPEIFIENKTRKRTQKIKKTKIRADSVYPGPASISTCSAFVIIPLSSTIPFHSLWRRRRPRWFPTEKEEKRPMMSEKRRNPNRIVSRAFMKSSFQAPSN